MHAVSTRPLCGLVLAGGRSSRMGHDKAEMVLPDGRRMGRKCHDLLREAGCEAVAVSLRDDQEIPARLREIEGLLIIRDSAGSSGPISGILAALASRPDADWLVLACDLPRLDAATVTHIAASRLVEDIFLAYRSEIDGLPEPLCAVYSPAALPFLQSALAQGNRSLRDLLLAHGARQLSAVTPGALDNANTPAEWESSVNPAPDWPAVLQEIWISPGNDFRGRHGEGRLEHGVQGVPQVECVAGRGLRGDRYFDYKSDFKGQVTFFEAAVVGELREHFALPALSSSVLRRNLIVADIALAEWSGRRFRFQGVDFQATEECKPCYWMNLAVAPGAEDFLQGNFRGGLRAKILTTGTLRVS